MDVFLKTDFVPHTNVQFINIQFPHWQLNRSNSVFYFDLNFPHKFQMTDYGIALQNCRFPKKFRLRSYLFLLMVSVVIFTWFYNHQHHRKPHYHQQNVQYKIYSDYMLSPKHGIRLKPCNIPRLDPFTPEVDPYISYKSEPPNCPQLQKHSLINKPPYSVQNGSLISLNPSVMNDIGPEFTCCYRPFHRKDEGNNWSESGCHALEKLVTNVSSQVEYLELFCNDPVSNTVFRDGLSLIPIKPEVEQRIKEFEDLSQTPKFPTENRLSILILGLDGTSRMNFIRAMPKSHEYLIKTMSAISLNGYTKVAENTLPNLIPCLTGRTLDEFKNECLSNTASIRYDEIHVDDCPFMWKDFAANGYRTGFSEDDVKISIFNIYYENAFLNPPTDYYLRPFSIQMQKEHSYGNGYCYGSSLSFEKLLDNARGMAEVFHNQPYFQFTWSTKLGHDDLNNLRWGDESLLKWLEHLNTNKLLNNTVLFIVSDHGQRLDRLRDTKQGKIEDRMPVAYIALPSWFSRRFPGYLENLKGNSEIITSPFDIHKTLYSLMNLESLEGKDEYWFQMANNDSIPLGKYKGTSLLRKIPENRTCFEAGIPLHWCTCHKRTSVNKKAEFVKDAAEFVVDSLNALLKERKRCAKLELKSIDEVSKWDESEILKKDCKTGDNCANENIIVLQIAITVMPSSATFETTVVQIQTDGDWMLAENVVRTNKYEGQSNCIEQIYKPYCYCV